jgi:hypothetical protein
MDIHLLGLYFFQGEREHEKNSVRGNFGSGFSDGCAAGSRHHWG